MRLLNLFSKESSIKLQALKKEQVDGYDIGVRSTTYDSRKTTIVLIHGIGVSSAYFIPLAQELAKTYNVIALDLPGYGKAAKPAKPLTIKELASTTRAFLSKHGLTNTILVGHSMGCQIIAHLTANYPADAKKRILLAPTVYSKERSLVQQGLRLLQDSFLEPFQTNIVIYMDYLRMGVVRYLKTAKWMVEDRIEVNLQDSMVPTLLVRGENDHIAPRSWLHYLSTLSQNITMYEVPHVPHAFHYKYAKELAVICQKFIED